MKLNVKLAEGAIRPVQASEGAACFDLYSLSVDANPELPYVEYDTGVRVSFDPDYVLLLFPRSSISETGFVLANSCGVIDSDYRGTIKFRFYDVLAPDENPPYPLGRRIGQFILIKKEKIELNICEELDYSVRGTGGFGSSGA